MGNLPFITIHQAEKIDDSRPTRMTVKHGNEQRDVSNRRICTTPTRKSIILFTNLQYYNCFH